MIMTEALMGTCILAVTTIIFVWVCSEYQIYNNEHSAEVVRLAGSTENSILAGSG